MWSAGLCTYIAITSSTNGANGRAKEENRREPQASVGNKTEKTSKQIIKKETVEVEKSKEKYDLETFAITDENVVEFLTWYGERNKENKGKNKDSLRMGDYFYNLNITKFYVKIRPEKIRLYSRTFLSTSA